MHAANPPSPPLACPGHDRYCFFDGPGEGEGVNTGPQRGLELSTRPQAWTGNHIGYVHAHAHVHVHIHAHIIGTHPIPISHTHVHHG